MRLRAIGEEVALPVDEGCEQQEERGHDRGEPGRDDEQESRPLPCGEVLNEHGEDEGSDVTVETLIDPLSGDVEAAWFYGL